MAKLTRNASPLSYVFVGASAIRIGDENVRAVSMSLPCWRLLALLGNKLHMQLVGTQSVPEMIGFGLPAGAADFFQSFMA